MEHLKPPFDLWNQPCKTDTWSHQSAQLAQPHSQQHTPCQTQHFVLEQSIGFRVRHSKCSAASSTQLPWKSDSTKIGKYRGYCHSHHLLQVWKRKPAPLQTGEEGARLEAIQSIQGHSQQRALLYCNKAIHAPFLVFALKGQVKDTHTLQSEKRPENAVNTCSDTHLHVLSRLTEHQGNNASGTQHQGMLSGGPPHGWEACGAAKTTCSEVCFLRVM